MAEYIFIHDIGAMHKQHNINVQQPTQREQSTKRVHISLTTYVLTDISNV